MKYRCIYAVEFPDNSVYIGLTYNFENRKKQHLTNSKSTVYKKVKDYPNTDLIHRNGFYFVNNPELTDAELDLISSLLIK